jgi:hypothetical protein
MDEQAQRKLRKRRNLLIVKREEKRSALNLISFWQFQNIAAEIETGTNLWRKHFIKNG